MSEQITPVVWGITDEHPEGIPVVPAWYHAAVIRDEVSRLTAERDRLREKLANLIGSCELEGE